jgi:hypothetical protein
LFVLYTHDFRLPVNLRPIKLILLDISITILDPLKLQNVSRDDTVQLLSIVLLVPTASQHIQRASNS